MSKAAQLDPILRKPEVLKLTGISSSQLYRSIRAGKFPRPLQLGTQARGWRSSEISAWLASLKPASADRGEAR